MKIWSSQHRCLVLMMLQIQRLKKSWLCSHLTHLPPNGCKPHFCWAPNLPGMSFARWMKHWIHQVSKHCRRFQCETWRMRPEVPSFEPFLGFDMCIVLKCMSFCPLFPIVVFFNSKWHENPVVFESFWKFAGFDSQMFDQIPPIWPYLLGHRFYREKNERI